PLLPRQPDDVVQVLEVGFVGGGRVPVDKRELVLAVGGRRGEAGATVEQPHHVHDVEALLAPAFEGVFRPLRGVAGHGGPPRVAHPEERGAVPDEVAAVLADLQHARPPVSTGYHFALRPSTAACWKSRRRSEASEFGKLARWVISTNASFLTGS